MRLRSVVASLMVLAICLLPSFALTASAQEETPTRTETYRAEVVEILEEGVTSLGPMEQPYQRLLVELKTGDRAGELVEVEVGVIELNRSDELFEPGDDVYVSYSAAAAAGQEDYFYITDRVRTLPLGILAGLFSVAIILLGRWQGLRALVGLGLTFIVIVWFLIPRILDGANPIGISVLSAFVIFSVTLFLVHGVSRQTLAAVTGTTLSLIITGTLAWLFVEVGHLTGLASEEAALLQVSAGGLLNAQGLLLGSIIIGALGVLDDVTVSQSSTVFELRRANPRLTAQNLFAAGVRVGKDHIAATVNTLVLAYVGAALPLMILFTQVDQPFIQILNREIVAEEIVRTLVGSLGLISAVPLTTGIASWLAVRTRPDQISDHHGHSHGHTHGHAHSHAHDHSHAPQQYWSE